MKSGDVVDILVVEDSDSERASTVEVLQESVPHVRVAAVANGDEALDFLFGRGEWEARAGQEPPRLILLDLALPGKDGFSILGKIRSMEPQDALTLAPIVIFTSSPAAEDIAKSYQCGANSYIIKPLSYLDFRKVVECVGQYWMTCNKTAL